MILAPVLIAGVSGLIASQNLWLDGAISERLILAFGGQIGPDEVLQLATSGTLGLELVFFFLLAAAAVWAGYKLGSTARIVVMLQLFVLSLLMQWAMWNWLKVASHFLEFVLSIALGCLVGYGMKLLGKQDTRFEAQYYELLLRNRELQETKLQLVKADEVERRMLAADLHDQVLNDLKAIRQKLEDYESTNDKATAESIRVLLNQAMGEIREVMDSLCPSALEHLGLSAAIDDCLRRGAERGGFRGRFKSKIKPGDLDDLSMVEQSLLYRLVQESITNICKHAQASEVRTNLEIARGHLIIQIIDDGKGIEFGKLKEDSRGVRYMRQRGDLIGAKIVWTPADGGRGTMVEIRMDLAGRENGKGSDS